MVKHRSHIDSAQHFLLRMQPMPYRIKAIVSLFVSVLSVGCHACFLFVVPLVACVCVATPWSYFTSYFDLLCILFSRITSMALSICVFPSNAKQQNKKLQLKNCTLQMNNLHFIRCKYDISCRCFSYFSHSYFPLCCFFFRRHCWLWQFFHLKSIISLEYVWNKKMFSSILSNVIDIDFQ